MQTKHCKERDGLLSPPQTPWWSSFGSQPLTTETLVVEASDSFAGVKVVSPETEQGGEKSLRDVSKPHVAFAVQSACFEFGFAQPTVYTKHPHVEHYYRVVSANGSSQMPAGRLMLPLKMETEEYGTVYVNSKQYHGIIRRRKSRAKAVLKNKISRSRKPYMHHSRHLHAMRRPRGSGGRFLNTKKIDAAKQFKPSNSQNSEVFHPENETMNSSREANGLNVSGSEVTSMDYFLSTSVHSLGGVVMPSKWIAATMDIGCCNLKT